MTPPTVSRACVPDLARQAAALLLLLGPQTKNPTPADKAEVGHDETARASAPDRGISHHTPS
jgi:hypothetical protein